MYQASMQTLALFPSFSIKLTLLSYCGLLSIHSLKKADQSHIVSASLLPTFYSTYSRGEKLKKTKGGKKKKKDFHLMLFF